MPSRTSEEMCLELWHLEQIRKLMSRYVYYSFAADWHEVPGMFADREDIWIDCEGFGTFDGDAGIRRFFVEWHRSLEGDGVGSMTLHPLTTEIIEVAGDGETARGLWISPGAEAKRSGSTGELEAFWIWGLYAIDFIRAGDEWRFWHFRIPHLLLSDYHHSWVDLAREDMTKQVANDGRPEADRPSQSEPAFYNVSGRPSSFFTPPRPFNTYADLNDHWVRSIAGRS